MKNTILLTFALLGAMFSFGQTEKNDSIPSDSAIVVKKHDWSLDAVLWGWTVPDGFTPSSWNMFLFDKNFIDFRYNYDGESVVSVYYGRKFEKTVKNVEMSTIPAIGIQAASDGSRQTFAAIIMHTSLSVKWFEFYTLNQYHISTRSGGSNLYYNATDLTCNVTKWLNLGFSDQIYAGDEFTYDLGPVIGFKVSNFYGKLYAWDPWSDKDRYFGILFGVHLSNEK